MSQLTKRLNEIFSATSEEEKEILVKAAQAIKDGKLVAFPTETVYGLGANALDSDAVANIYKAKGRPSDNPLILHVSSIEMVKRLVEINDKAETLMEAFWPGPLSIVLPAKDVIPLRTRGGLETAAVRMPDNRIALEIIKESDLPIAAPSANKSGRPSPTDAQTVRNDIGDKAAYIIDGGETLYGLESTVIDMTGTNPVMLRPGGITAEQIESVLGIKVVKPMDKNTIKRSPGTRYRHYAPKLPMLLSTAEDAEKNVGTGKWGWIGVHEPVGNPDEKVIFENQEEYAHELFRVLREIENSNIEIIVAEIPANLGIGRALRDRLNRAAGI